MEKSGWLHCQYITVYVFNIDRPTGLLVFHVVVVVVVVVVAVMMIKSCVFTVRAYTWVPRFEVFSVFRNA